MSNDIRDESLESWVEYEEFVRDRYLKSVMSGVSTNVGGARVRSAFSTGFAGFDQATGFGGIPRGRLVEIFGETDTGKTALALHLACSVQNSGGRSVYLDTEGKFQDDFARVIGLKDEGFHICENQVAEDVFDICEILALGGDVDLVVIDSLTALLSQDEYDRLCSSEYQDESENVGLINDSSAEGFELFATDIFRVINRGLRRLQTASAATGCTFVLINQLRSNFNSVTNSTLVSTGGNTVFLRAELRIQLYRNSEILVGTEAVGVNLSARLVKNNYSLKHPNVWLVFYYATGFSISETLILNAVQLGILQRQEDGVYYKDRKLGEDRADICQYFTLEPDLVELISRELRVI